MCHYTQIRQLWFPVQARRAFQVLAPVLLALLVLPICAAEVIDRIVATVNSRVILQSDWEDAVAYEALIENQPEARIDRAALLERLIDQELLRQQMPPDMPLPGPEEVARQMADIRRQYSGASTPEGWAVMLSRYGLTESGLAERIATHLAIMRFIDERLRPSVHIDSATIEKYYRDKFLPELRRAGGGDVPLAEVSSGIEDVLAEQRVGDLLSTWLKNLRTQSNIRVLTPPVAQSAEVR
jgi:hypothetical protein